MLDNCSIHHDEDIRRLIEQECGLLCFFFLVHDRIKYLSCGYPSGAKLIHLPPYSPDFNPIEQSFHSLKAWLRRHENEAVNPGMSPMADSSSSGLDYTRDGRRDGLRIVAIISLMNEYM